MLPRRGVVGGSPRPQSVLQELGEHPGEGAELDRGRTRHRQSHPHRDLGARRGAGGNRLGGSDVDPVHPELAPRAASLYAAQSDTDTPDSDTATLVFVALIDARPTPVGVYAVSVWTSPVGSPYGVGAAARNRSAFRAAKSVPAS